MDKRQILLFGLILLAIACSGQVRSSAFRVMLRGLLKHTVPEIGVQEAARDSSSIVFLDAREPQEYAVSHIQDAIFAGYDHFDLGQLPPLDHNKRIVVYCSVGYRSEKITEKLHAAGFAHVSNLYGGIFEWVNQGFPVYNTTGPTQEVHAFDHSWGVWLRKGKKVYSSK
jgi:rhodanese-related sulfurtransferase